MELDFRIKINERLYLRNPEESVLGRKIVRHGLKLINKLGFEDFTFRKLATEINTTEASVYRYFENKHRLLLYLINWYWSHVEYKVIFNTHNIKSSELRLRQVISILVDEPKKEKKGEDFISESDAYQLVLWEGSKAYLTRHVNKDNEERFFKPYKDLSVRIASLIKECNPRYRYPNSLASTLLEMSHAQKFFMKNLPTLTDMPGKNNEPLIEFLSKMVFDAVLR